MPEDVVPIGYGPSLNELIKMEGDYAFQWPLGRKSKDLSGRTE